MDDLNHRAMEDIHPVVVTLVQVVLVHTQTEVTIVHHHRHVEMKCTCPLHSVLLCFSVAPIAVVHGFSLV